METKNEFVFENGAKIQVPIIENEVSWFIATEVCDILNIADARQAVERLDDDEKRKEKILFAGQNREIWLINEFGLYSVILTSEKPEAKTFKRWITHVVLPSIRINGKYTTEEANEREELIQSKIKEIDLAELNIVETKKLLNTQKEKLDKLQSQLKEILKTNFRQLKLDFLTDQV